MFKVVKSLSFLLFLVGITSLVVAQASVNSSGGDAFGTGGTAAFSLGQVTYTTIGGNGLTIAQGVQQPFIEPAVAIPTISEWASMILMLLFMIAGILILRTQEVRFKIRQKDNQTLSGV